MNSKKSAKLSISERATELLLKIDGRSKNPFKDETIRIIRGFARQSSEFRRPRYISYDVIENYCLKKLR